MTQKYFKYFFKFKFGMWATLWCHAVYLRLKKTIAKLITTHKKLNWKTGWLEELPFAMKSHSAALLPNAFNPFSSQCLIRLTYYRVGKGIYHHTFEKRLCWPGVVFFMFLDNTIKPAHVPNSMCVSSLAQVQNSCIKASSISCKLTVLSPPGITRPSRLGTSHACLTQDTSRLTPSSMPPFCLRHLNKAHWCSEKPPCIARMPILIFIFNEVQL